MPTIESTLNRLNYAIVRETDMISAMLQDGKVNIARQAQLPALDVVADSSSDRLCSSTDSSTHSYHLRADEDDPVEPRKYARPPTSLSFFRHV